MTGLLGRLGIQRTISGAAFSTRAQTEHGGGPPGYGDAGRSLVRSALGDRRCLLPGAEARPGLGAEAAIFVPCFEYAALARSSNGRLLERN